MTISILGNHLSVGPCLPLYWNETKNGRRAGHNGYVLESLGEIPECRPTAVLLSLRFKLQICIVNELLYRLKRVSLESSESFTMTWEGSLPSLKSFMVAHICRKSHWELLLSNWISPNSVRMMEFLGNRDPHLVSKDEMGW